MTTCSRFRKFGENIKLTTAQYDDAKTKYDNVCRTLHNHYYPKSEYNGSTKLLIGSYGKETAIRPPGDVDVIFKIPFVVTFQPVVAGFCNDKIIYLCYLGYVCKSIFLYCFIFTSLPPVTNIS